MHKKPCVSQACYTCMQYFKQIRLEKNISPKDISKYLSRHGIDRDPKTIYGWELGQSEPTLEMTLLIARYLDCPDLFEISGIPFSQRYSEKVPNAALYAEKSPLLSQAERQLIEGYRLDPDVHQMIDALMRLYQKTEGE